MSSSSLTRNHTAPVLNLATLSPELLYEIFKYFCPHCRHDHYRGWRDGKDVISIATVKALCLTSRRIRDIAQPFLYHRPCQPLWLAPFLRTILERKDLAKQVRQWSYGGQVHSSFSRWENEEVFQPIAAVAKTLPQRYLVDPVVKVAGKHTFPGPRLLNELVISMLTSLEWLTAYMDCYVWRDTNVEANYRYVRNRYIHQPMRLEAVTTLSIESTGLSGFSIVNPDVGVVVPACRGFERLIFVDLGGVSDIAFSHRTAALSSFDGSLERVTTFIMSGCYIPDDPDKNNYRGLSSLLSYCPSLEYFLYEAKSCMGGSGSQHISPSRILSALWSRKATLRHLVLNLLDANIHSGYLSAESTLVSRQSLDRFQKLETLSLDERSYCRHWFNIDQDGYPWEIVTCLSDLIGPNIKSLVLKLSELSQTCTLYDIIHFAEKVGEGRYPNLERLHIILEICVHRTSIEDVWNHTRLLYPTWLAIHESLEGTRVAFSFEEPLRNYYHNPEHNELF